jgi:hypothetical protein
VQQGLEGAPCQILLRLRAGRRFYAAKFFIAPEMFPTLLDGFAAWRDAHRESMEAFEFFAGGGGGFGILNVPDEATLNRIMVQYPFTPFSELTIRSILDGDTALGQWREIMSEMMGAGPGVEPSH